MRGEYKTPNDLISTRLFLSTQNGILYVTPAGILELMKLLNRIHIYVSNRDPDKYKEAYQEVDVINRHVIL